MQNPAGEFSGKRNDAAGSLNFYVSMSMVFVI
jgi:hypothetical protein